MAIRFIHPDCGSTLIQESALALADRTLTVGDVVKRKSSDASSGMIIKTSLSCLLEPIYNELPYHGSEPWDHLAQDNRLRVPSEDLQFLDYEPGDRVIYEDHIGEILDIFEEVSVRLSNGAVVKVHDPDLLEVADYIYRAEGSSAKRPSLVVALERGRKRRGEIKSINQKEENTGPPSCFYPGQTVLTTKANLRLGHWIIGSYTADEPPRGIVVDVRVSSIRADWIASKTVPSGYAPESPEKLVEFPELDNVKLYNKNNLSSTAGNTSNMLGARHGHDFSVGDIVKFRDVAGAAVKYSEQSPNRTKHGFFRRIPRMITQGFDMNTFQVKKTFTQVLVQWQDGKVTEEDSNQLYPYINVDDHDVWVGEIVSLRSAEETRDGITRLKEVGVVQSVDALERIAQVRWFDNPSVSIYENKPSLLVLESVFGTISDRESSVALFDITAYPALTKRRGDLVIIYDRAIITTAKSVTGPSILENDNTQPSAAPDQTLSNEHRQSTLSPKEIRWIGEVVDLGLDGLLTVRLGALDKPEDVKIPVHQAVMTIGGDDFDSEDDQSLDDYFSDMSEVLAMGEDETMSLEEELPAPVFQTFEYEGGRRMDSGTEDDWISYGSEEDGLDDKDQADSRGSAEEKADEDVEMKDISADISLTGPAGEEESEVRPDQARSTTNQLQVMSPQGLQRDTQYRFSTFGNMPPQFEIVEGDAHSGHYYYSRTPKFSSTLLRRVRKEHSMLENNLPEGIWIRTWDDRLDLLRVLILGPRGTPYELAPFLLDFKLEDDFPRSPPSVHFHSWTYGVGRVNPNLYEDGKVCLSVLGTWDHGSEYEGWSAFKSSLLQVIVSLLGLVLVDEPYYSKIFPCYVLVKFSALTASAMMTLRHLARD